MACFDGVSMSGWIKCSERLPKKFEKVLVYGELCLGTTIAFGLINEKGTWSLLPVLNEVYYWQPLPLPPEDL